MIRNAFRAALRLALCAALATTVIPLEWGTAPSRALAVAPELGTTMRLSVDSGGAQGDSESFGPAISADGRYVAFHSDATNLVAGDTNGRSDVFVRDTQTGTTTRVSVHSTGTQGNGDCGLPAISADGRYVAFHSDATNLVAGDTNDRRDVFVRDTQTGTTKRVSVHSTGTQGLHDSGHPVVSSDGRYVAFDSNAANLVAGDTNGQEDVFVRDTQSGTTTRVSVHSTGAQGNDASFCPAISADGRRVAFTSWASNLVTGDTNDTYDLYVHDWNERTTIRVNVDSAGAQAQSTPPDLDDFYYAPAISADGRYVAFGSPAPNLVPRDTNEAADVFVRDTHLGTTMRLSVSSTGMEGKYMSWAPAISANGRYVVFRSLADNLVSSDTNGADDIFLRDTQTNSTGLVSVNTGAQGQGHTTNEWDSPVVSDDGRRVAFTSGASDLVPNDTNGVDDVFMRDLVGTGTGTPTDPYTAPDSDSAGVKPLIVLIGGLKSDCADRDDDPLFGYLRQYLRGRGHDVTIIPSMPGARDGATVDSTDGYGAISAMRVDAWLKHEGYGGRRVILIGHSMGGLIARTYAHNWDKLSSGCRPIAIVQLGTPNEGSPVALLSYLYGIDDSFAVQWLQSGGGVNRHYNRVYSNEGARSLPIYRLAGTYFPDSAVPAPWSQTWLRARESGVLKVLEFAFGTSANDGAVSRGSLSGGPSAGNAGTWEYPVKHTETFPFVGSVFPDAGTIVPSSFAGYEAKIVNRITTIIRDVEAQNPASSQRAATLAVPRAESARAESAESPIESAGWFASAAESRSSADPFAVDFSVEGTSCILSAGSDAGSASFSVAKADGTPIPCETESDSSGTRGVLTDLTPGNYRATVVPSGTGTTTFSALDTGPSELRIQSPPQVDAGELFTISASVYESGIRRTGGAIQAGLDGGTSVVLHDDGAAPDPLAGDGEFSAALRAPTAGSSTALRMMASGVNSEGAAFVRVARMGIAVREPRGSLRGSYDARTRVGPSGKVEALLVDVGLNVSKDCEVMVSAAAQSAGSSFARPSTTLALHAGQAATATLEISAQELHDGLAPGGAYSITDVSLLDTTDDIPCMLDTASGVLTGSLNPSTVGIAQCTVGLAGSNPTSATVVSLTGSAVCTTESVTGVELTFDRGATWYASPEPVGGWGAGQGTWNCAFTLPEGSYGVKARALGASGPIPGAEDTAAFAVDRTKPITSVDVPATSMDKATASITATDGASGSGVVCISYRVDDAAVKTVEGAECSPDFSAPGAHAIEVWGTDSAGNESAHAVREFTIDPVAPMTLISGVPSGWSNGATLVTLSATDNSGGSGIVSTHCRIGAVAEQTYTTPFTVSTEGTTTIEYWSVDNAGNEELPHKTVTVRIDKTTPSTICDAKTASYPNVATLKLSATDTFSGVAYARYSLDGGAWTKGTSITTTKVRTHTLRYYAVDNAGNAESIRTATFRVIGPVTLSTPSATRVGTRTYTLQGTLKPRHTAGTKPIRVHKYRLVSGKWKSYGYSVATASNYSTYSRYKVKVKFPYKGTWRVRAYHPADSSNTATWSGYSRGFAVR